MEKLTRAEAWNLLTEYTKGEALQKHALAVAAVMAQFPEEHCHKSEEIMREHGVDEFYIRAMNCHGWGLCTDVEPQSRLEKTLYTVDELCGLINAACLMRPSKSVLDIEVKSVKKKFKDKAFAAGVNREVIRKGCELLGMDLDEVIRETIAGMQEKAEDIGLKGNL